MSAPDRPKKELTDVLWLASARVYFQTFMGMLRRTRKAFQAGTFNVVELRPPTLIHYAFDGQTVRSGEFQVTPEYAELQRQISRLTQPLGEFLRLFYAAVLANPKLSPGDWRVRLESHTQDLRAELTKRVIALKDEMDQINLMLENLSKETPDSDQLISVLADLKGFETPTVLGDPVAILRECLTRWEPQMVKFLAEALPAEEAK